MPTWKHRGSWLLASSHPAKGAEIHINNIFRWASMARGAYKASMLLPIKVKISICSTMRTTSKEARTEILLSGLKDLWAARRTLACHLEMAESSSICSSASNSITKSLSRLEIRTITTCTRRCQANLHTTFNQADISSNQLASCTNTNQPIASAKAINTAKWHRPGGAERHSCICFENIIYNVKA